MNGAVTNGSNVVMSLKECCAALSTGERFMDFVSIEFYLFLAVVVVLYYIMPLRFRWLVLLTGSMYYFCAITYYRRELIVFLGIIVVSWLLGLLQEKLLHLEAVSEAENRADCKTGGAALR